MEFSHYAIRHFHASQYRTHGGTFDNYRYLPRTFASIGYLMEGEWQFDQYIHTPSRDYTNSGTVKSGQLLYVPLGSTYTANWLTYPCANCISIHFELSSGIFTDRKTSIQAVDKDLFEKTAGINVTDEFKKILDLYNSSIHGVRELKFEILSRLYNIIGGLSKCLVRKQEDEFDELIEPAIRFMNEHPEELVSVPELAKLCKISESYFYLRFNRSVGISPIEYKNRLMISRAQCLLTDHPKLTIESIVDKCGFASSAYFRKIFKQTVGLSPRDYRKMSAANETE